MSYPKIVAVFLAFFFIAPNLSLAQFSDIQKDSLVYLHRHNMIDGYPNGTFGPQKKINRAELSKLVVEATGTKLLPEKNCFPDVVSGAWYEIYVCTAKKLGYIDGYPDGTFKPEQFINKVEALKITAKAQKWELSTGYPANITGGMYDVAKGSWYYDYVNAAIEYTYIDKVSYFHPANFITREEVAEILFRKVLEFKMGVERSIGSDLAVLSRDFFRIEAATMGKTYSDFEKFKNEQKEFPVAINYQTGEKTFEQPQTIIQAKNGSTYAIMDVYLDNILEYDDKITPTHMDILLIAKFDASKKMLSFDWYNYFLENKQNRIFKLIDANDNKITVQSWSKGADPMTPYGLADTFEYNLEDVR